MAVRKRADVKNRRNGWDLEPSVWPGPLPGGSAVSEMLFYGSGLIELCPQEGSVLCFCFSSPVSVEKDFSHSRFLRILAGSAEVFRRGVGKQLVGQSWDG
eukprot:Plantae.Rhodophyta-Palmaria_palmata.ctg7503.p3 GENE.Plantae.Rhodophyta-Palmaria_palmata.ctg7503~~Plantae.Rhodophyta-Palmaria_palmata.ctg7503.p3  ORF type:complete len:100 (+),score=9.28 Plantae.Rhodophyta-Palmaria_palmata.ctg7503:343-642(+)